jgi:hypothetical protein
MRRAAAREPRGRASDAAPPAAAAALLPRPPGQTPAVGRPAPSFGRTLRGRRPPAPLTLSQRLIMMLASGPRDARSPAARRCICRHGLPGSHGPGKDDPDVGTLTLGYESFALSVRGCDPDGGGRDGHRAAQPGLATLTCRREDCDTSRGTRTTGRGPARRGRVLRVVLAVQPAPPGRPCQRPQVPPRGSAAFTLHQPLRGILAPGPCDPGRPSARRRLCCHGVPRSHGPGEETLDAEKLTFGDRVRAADPGRSHGRGRSPGAAAARWPHHRRGTVR